MIFGTWRVQSVSLRLFHRRSHRCDKVRAERAEGCEDVAHAEQEDPGFPKVAAVGEHRLRRVESEFLDKVFQLPAGVVRVGAFEIAIDAFPIRRRGLWGECSSWS